MFIFSLTVSEIKQGFLDFDSVICHCCIILFCTSKAGENRDILLLSCNRKSFNPLKQQEVGVMCQNIMNTCVK